MNKRIVFLFIICMCASLFLLTINFINKYSNETIDFKIESLIPSYNNSDFIMMEFRKRLKNEIIILLNSKNSDVSNASKFIKEELDRTNLVFFKTNDFCSECKKKIFENRYIFNIPTQLQNKGENPTATIENFVIDILFNPFSSITSQELQNDPFLTMRSLATKMMNSKYEYEDNNLFITKDSDKYLVINAHIRENLNSDELNTLYSSMIKIKEILKKENITMEFSGEIFFAITASQTSVNEMTKIGLFSTVVLVILFIVNFRSIIPIIISVISLSISLLFGFLSVIAIYDSIHIMTLTLSTTLVGICVDYYIHTFFFTSSENKLTKFLLFPLAISLMTSLIAYLVMIFSNMLILKQLAVFAVVALITTYAFIYILINTYKHKTIIKKVTFIDKCYAISQSKIVFKSFAFLVIVIISGGIFICLTCNPDDDVSKMQKKDPLLEYMNDNINNIINNGSNINWYVINGETTEQSFQICETLQPLIQSKDTFIPCSIIPSKKQQSINIEFFRSNYSVLKESFHKHNVELNDSTNGLDNAHIITPEESPIDLSFFLHKGKILIKIDKNETQAISFINNHDNLIIKLNGRTMWNNTFTMFRVQFNKILVISYFLSSIFLSFYFKKLIITHYILPMLTGFACSILSQYWLGNGYFNLFTTLAMFLVLGLGADYCIFIKTITKTNYQFKIRALIVTLLTTEASFGALAFSSSAAIASFGTTLAFGLIGIFFTNLIISICSQREIKVDLS